MKIFKHAQSLVLSLSLLTLAGCEDKEDDKVSPNLSLLTSSEWVGDKVYVNGDEVTDEFNEEAYYYYNIKLEDLKFDKAGTYVQTYTNEPSDGKWEFTDNEQKIIFDKGSEDERTAIINKLTSTELYLFFDNADFNDDGVETDIEFRYKH